MEITRHAHPKGNLRSVISFHLESLPDGILISPERGFDIGQLVLAQIAISGRDLSCRVILEKRRRTRRWHCVNDFHLPRVHRVEEFLIFVRIGIGEIGEIGNCRLSSPLISNPNRFGTMAGRGLLIDLKLLECCGNLALVLRRASAGRNRVRGSFQSLFQGSLRPFTFLF